ncbi:unnamed protein product [Urochloa decumbens]|uniref:Uncharacterized protein n=1 Tax=Urochloa decumbens TaxID=240449 RepID=A0ABC9E8B1_9POAL
MARMAATKLRASAPAAVAALLLATCLLALAATVTDAGRPLKEEQSSSSSEGDDAVRTAAAVVESPASDIQTVVGAAEHDDGSGSRDDGRAFMSIDMLGGIKDSGPSPGAGH